MGELKDADFLREARERFQAGLDADRENRKRDEADRRFFKGEQWDDNDVKARAGRPTLTVNRLPQFVKQVTGEMRQNKPAIRVLPVDDQTDPKLAEVYSAIIRHIESNSDAHRTYSKAAEQAVVGGIGWFRVLTDYMDETSFEQEILIKHVRNPLSVVVDPDARELCKQDMNWAFVTEQISRKKFEREHPDVPLVGFDSPNEEYSQWINGDFIRVAEYWYRKPVKRTLVMLNDGSTRYADEITGEAALQMQEAGLAVMMGPDGEPMQREVMTHKVCWCRMTGSSVIDKGEWKGKYIPLIPVVGEEVEVGDEVFRHGLIHHTKDAQRSYNFARSAMVEGIASQPKAPWLVTADQIKSYKSLWENANSGNPPFLPYEVDPKAPPPQRIAPPQMPVAWYQEAQIADMDMKATTGIYDASLGNKGNETSGRAIMARDQQGETATFVYVDNTSAAILHAGNMLIDLIPHIYSDERIIRIIGEDGTIEEYARINSRLPDGSAFNDITQGRYDVEVTTGPAFATKRQEASEKMLQLAQSVPEIGQVAGDMIVKALDLPYGDKLAERIQMGLLPPGLDEEVDKKRMEAQARMQEAQGPQQPDPAQEFQMRAMQAEVAGKEAETAAKGFEAQRKQAEAMQAMQGPQTDPRKEEMELAILEAKVEQERARALIAVEQLRAARAGADRSEQERDNPPVTQDSREG